ncbi:MAG: Asp-tRNA(Asn)/Glu-tRNA(Gln) amidotransferase subunit GatC [Candidatus Bathyarchaeia archaeon]
MSEKTISKKDVEHIALLARIELSEEEKELFTEQFNRILDYFHKIDELDLEDVEPTYHVLTLFNVFREDELTEPLKREMALLNAARKNDGYIKAPKII